MRYYYVLLEEAGLPQDGRPPIPIVLRRENNLVSHPLLFVGQPHPRSHTHMVRLLVSSHPVRSHNPHFTAGETEAGGSCRHS